MNRVVCWFKGHMFRSYLSDESRMPYFARCMRCGYLKPMSGHNGETK